MSARKQAYKDIKEEISDHTTYNNVGMVEVWDVCVTHVFNNELFKIN